MIVTIILSLVVALPVVSVHATSPNVTYFTGTATFYPDGYVPGTTETLGRCELSTGTVVQFDYVCTDPRFTGRITNTLMSITKPNGKTTVWSTSSNFDITGGGTITGRLWGQGIRALDVLTAHYIGYGDGFKVIMQYTGDYISGDVSGKIIET
jgi:hypothetical protein